MSLSLVPPPAPEATPEPGFVVDLDGFEGPIDLLLNLAREQKVDLAKISILALAEQYLAYIQRARDLHLEVAANYLVTAAWLTYLKSRLLLPAGDDDDDEPSAVELAARLAERLRRLDAVRRAAELLWLRPQLGQGRLERGTPEGLVIRHQPRFRARIHDLLQAYVAQYVRGREHKMVLGTTRVVRVEDALRAISRQLGGPDWRTLLSLIPAEDLSPERRRAALAAHFAASLELARDGHLELRQASPFGPIYLRRKRHGEA